MRQISFHGEGTLQVAFALRRRKAGLEGRVATTDNIANEWQAGGPSDRPCDLGCLVKSSQSVAPPVERHRQQRVYVVRKSGRQQHQQVRKGRRVEQLAPKLQGLNRRIDRERILVWRNDERERRLIATRIGHSHKITQATIANWRIKLPGTAKHTTKRTNSFADPAPEPGDQYQ